MSAESQQTFLQQLLNKKAMVLKVQHETGRSQAAALAEVDRQIRQLLRGEEVTKSGKED